MRYPRLRINWSIQAALSAESARLRLANYYHLLRAIVHFHNGWIPRTPSIDVKILLGIHLHEDASFLTSIARRMRSMGWTGDEMPPPGAKLAAIVGLLERLETWEEYTAAVYNVVKPALIDAWESHYTVCDPVIDEPTRRILSDFLRVTSQHISGGMSLIESLLGLQGPISKRVHAATTALRDLWHGTPDDPFALGGTAPLRLRPRPRIALPARDAFCYTATADTPPYVIAPKGALSPEVLRGIIHDQIQRELLSAELCALLSHDHPDYPWEFHRDMARMVWDEMRHAQVLENLLGRVGDTNWGEYPLFFAPFTAAQALTPAGQLRALGSVTREEDFARLQHYTEIEVDGTNVLPFVIDHLRAEEQYHEAIGTRWAAWIDARPS